ncbi:MAG: DUF2817 domain-containing protein [Calditrichaeota bacterium]|nr:DUF2817 domain-containing protein [Calditrichota bacterium]
MMKYMQISVVVVLVASLFFGCGKERPEAVDRFETDVTGADRLYHTFDAVLAELNQLKADHPQQVHLFSLGQSVKKRPIPLVRMDFNNGTVSSRYLFVAGTHGDEAAGVEALLYAMKALLQMDEAARNSMVKKGVEVYFVPVHNPDGFIINERENGRGVDLNRNFPFGYETQKMEPETKALVDLVNSVDFSAGIFFHSANDEKYENVVRVPFELSRGKVAMQQEEQARVWRLAHLIEAAGNKLNSPIKYRSSREMVDASGIASDWCMSAFVAGAQKKLVRLTCRNPHPSVTVELCYPKQPMKAERLQQEKDEAFAIVWAILNEF